MLPDMSGLRHLEEIRLQGKFHFPKDLDDGAPFSTSVRKLNIWVSNNYVVSYALIALIVTCHTRITGFHS